MSNGLFSKDTQKAVDNLLSKERKVPDQLYPLGTYMTMRNNNGFFIKTSIHNGEKVHWACMYMSDNDGQVIRCFYDHVNNDEIAKLEVKASTTKTPISADGYLIEPDGIFYFNFEGHERSNRYPPLKVITSVYGRDVFVQRVGESDFNYLVVPSTRLLKKDY